MLPVLLCVAILVFTIIYFTPGDPAMAVLGTNYTPEAYAAKVKEMGLDKPYIIQLGTYLLKIVTKFDFGRSYINNRSVTAQLFERAEPTLIIAVMGVALSQLIAIPVGITAATHHGKPLDYTVSTLCIVLAAIPGFLLAVFLMLIFCMKLKWLNAAGITNWTSYILPVICSIFAPMVTSCRMTRSSMLEVIRQDYIRTARAKGVSERDVISRHALKNALIPVLTMMGMHLGGAMGGSILVETIYTVPGIGTLMKQAIYNQDYPVVEGCVIFVSFLMCLLMLITDLAYAAVDPRVRDSMSGSRRRKHAGNAAKPKEVSV